MFRRFSFSSELPSKNCELGSFKRYPKIYKCWHKNISQLKMHKCSKMLSKSSKMYWSSFQNKFNIGESNYSLLLDQCFLTGGIGKFQGTHTHKKNIKLEVHELFWGWKFTRNLQEERWSGSNHCSFFLAILPTDANGFSLLQNFIKKR